MIKYFNGQGPFKMSILLRAQFQKSYYTNGKTEIEDLSQAPYLKTTSQLVENPQAIDKTLDYMIDDLFHRVISYQYEKSGKFYVL